MHRAPKRVTRKMIASMIDHTALKPETTPEQIRTLCVEAVEHGFASVCINSCYVPLAAACLKETQIKVCTVVGFPLGAASGASKAFETIEAIRAGAEEVDMVLNVGFFKAGMLKEAGEDIRAVVAAAGGRAAVKVIIETCLLTDKEKVAACRAAMKAGAQFVKTSTGFAGGGATVEDVRLMRWTVGSKLGVKASGGIRDRATAAAMIRAGANRLGTSQSVAIVGE